VKPGTATIFSDPVRENRGDEAQVVQPEARQAVLFVATIPGATEGRYGLALARNSSWSWSGAVVISSAKTVSEFHAAAANASGIVKVEQRQAFDSTDF